MLVEHLKGFFSLLKIHKKVTSAKSLKSQLWICRENDTSDFRHNDDFVRIGTMILSGHPLNWALPFQPPQNLILYRVKQTTVAQSIIIIITMLATISTPSESHPIPCKANYWRSEHNNYNNNAGGAGDFQVRFLFLFHCKLYTVLFLVGW